MGQHLPALMLKFYKRSISMTIYLYKKTHNLTGLKYLGKTESPDPHKYTGSGIYWLTHLKVHGKNYTTEIVKECKSIEELKYWGKYYSDLWNIVESEEWANLKEEVGDGGRQSEKVRKIIGEKGRGRTPWNKNKKIWSEDERRKIGMRNKLRGPQTTHTIQKRISKLLGQKRTNIQCDNISKSLKGKTFTESHKKALQGPRPHVVAHNRDKTKYHFVHNSGLEEYCTRYELIAKYSLIGQLIGKVISGKRKSHAGWTLCILSR